MSANLNSNDVEQLLNQYEAELSVTGSLWRAAAVVEIRKRLRALVGAGPAVAELQRHSA